MKKKMHLKIVKIRHYYSQLLREHFIQFGFNIKQS